MPNLETLSVSGSKINRQGLLKGTCAPEITGTSLSGQEISLGDYRGSHVLLVFSDPTCGPCNQLAPLLEKLHRRTPDIAVLMISRGTIESNSKKAAEYGFTFPIVLQRAWELSKLYALFLTPCAYLVDTQGNIGADVAIGTEAILTLLRGTAILSLLQTI